MSAAETKTKSRRGFGAMSVEKRTEIARKGGAAVPAEKRSFSKDPALAARAGAIGGRFGRFGQPEAR
jgi:general stress protein YciG